MLYEVDTFGIKATLVEPGHMRIDEPQALGETAVDVVIDAPGRSMKLNRYGHFFVKSPSGPYDTPTSPAGHTGRVLQWMADRQPTSATKSAELVWQLGHCRYPPLRLLLGTFAIESIRDRLRAITEEIEDWKHLHFPSPEENGGKGKRGDAKDDDDMKMEGDAEEGDDYGVDMNDADVGADIKEEDEG